MLKIHRTSDYEKMEQELLLENPELEFEVSGIIMWFRKNPQDTRLDNHPLTKIMDGQNHSQVFGYRWTQKSLQKKI